MPNLIYHYCEGTEPYYFVKFVGGVGFFCWIIFFIMIMGDKMREIRRRRGKDIMEKNNKG